MNVFLSVPLLVAIAYVGSSAIQFIAKIIITNMIIKHSKELSDKQTQAICNMMRTYKKYSGPGFTKKS